jgi:hypothetical protein
LLTRCLILGWPLDVINDHDVDWPENWFQLESELFLQRGED